ncbi:uncharacterized protein [Procambarus clarkii]|uniref:uncharacterized protein n=1 Tax=Procambarus clarkii TaxID=6728 RepID=UPI001E671FC4|nr:uncharacterized protein LOC123772290 [Procambarus clarkii]
MRAVMLVVCAVVVLLPESEGTLDLAALKVLKLIGLAKLKKGVLGSKNSEGLPSLGSPFRDLADSGYDSRPSYGPSHYTGGGPPAFYIVPASYFDDHYRRGKRDTKASLHQSVGPVPGTLEVASGSLLQEEEEQFRVLREEDADGCVLRLVCELAAAPAHTLTHDEQLIMAVFSSSTDAPANTDLSNSRRAYDEAAWLGRRSTNPSQSCAAVYSTCPVSAKQLMKVFSTAELTQQAQLHP